MASRTEPCKPDPRVPTAANNDRRQVRTANQPKSTGLELARSSRGVTTPVPRVYLPVSLTGPGPSGSAGPTRLRRGCSHPPRRSPDQAAASFTPPLRRRGTEGLPPPSDPAAPRGAHKHDASSLRSTTARGSPLAAPEHSEDQGAAGRPRSGAPHVQTAGCPAKIEEPFAPVVMPAAPNTFFPDRLNKVSSTAIVSAAPAGSVGPRSDRPGPIRARPPTSGRW